MTTTDPAHLAAAEGWWAHWETNGEGDNDERRAARALHAEYDRRGAEIEARTRAAAAEHGALVQARAEVARLAAECDATAESLMEVAGQRIAAIAVCRDLEREAEHLRGQAGRVAWEKGQAVAAAVARLRKALGVTGD